MSGARENVAQFLVEIDKVIDRTRSEYEMTYAEVIGALQMKIMDLHSEAKGDDE